jgi:hypothetical protein
MKSPPLSTVIVGVLAGAGVGFYVQNWQKKAKVVRATVAARWRCGGCGGGGEKGR